MQDECGLHIWLLLSFLHPHSPIRRRCWYLTEYQKVRSKSKPFSFLMIVMVMITLVGKTFSRPAASAVRCEDGMAIFKLYPHCSITYTLAQFLFKHALWSLVVPSSYTSLFLLSHILLCQLLKLHWVLGACWKEQGAFSTLYCLLPFFLVEFHSYYYIFNCTEVVQMAVK